MKIYISDICGACCPETVLLGEVDRAMAERIKKRSFEKIGLEPVGKKRRFSRPVRTAFMLAAIISLLSVSAFATMRFSMHRENVAETVSGYWRELDESGNVLSEQKIVFPDASMVFTFEGPETDVNKPEFRCFWLPSEADFGYTDEEGWTNYLSDSGEGASIPWIVGAGTVNTAKSSLVLSGDAEVVREEKRDNWYVLEISSDYSACKDRYIHENDRANYILMFDEERGWLVSVKGTSDLDTLRRIAENLEIRESDQPRPSYENTESIGMLGVGRG